MAAAPKVSFWSRQCEHQNAPYMRAPAADSRRASSTALSEDSVDTTGRCGPTAAAAAVHTHRSVYWYLHVVLR